MMLKDAREGDIIVLDGETVTIENCEHAVAGYYRITFRTRLFPSGCAKMLPGHHEVTLLERP